MPNARGAAFTLGLGIIAALTPILILVELAWKQGIADESSHEIAISRLQPHGYHPAMLSTGFAKESSSRPRRALARQSAHNCDLISWPRTAPHPRV